MDRETINGTPEYVDSLYKCFVLVSRYISMPVLGECSMLQQIAITGVSLEFAKAPFNHN